jgi:hypothetical protein
MLRRFGGRLRRLAGATGTAAAADGPGRKEAALRRVHREADDPPLRDVRLFRERGDRRRRAGACARCRPRQAARDEGRRIRRPLPLRRNPDRGEHHQSDSSAGHDVMRVSVHPAAARRPADRAASYGRRPRRRAHAGSNGSAFMDTAASRLYGPRAAPSPRSSLEERLDLGVLRKLPCPSPSESDTCACSRARSPRRRRHLRCGRRARRSAAARRSHPPRAA